VTGGAEDDRVRHGGRVRRVRCLRTALAVHFWEQPCWTSSDTAEMSRKDAKDAKQRGLSQPCAAAEAAAHALIGAAIEVHRHLGPGFTETTYERALVFELELRNLRFERQAAAHVSYKGRVVGEHRFDLIVAESLIVELKVVESISSTHVSQVISYLRASELDLGLLINFNVPVLQQGIRRVVWSP
jgi:GxxExxY protein